MRLDSLSRGRVCCLSLVPHIGYTSSYPLTIPCFDLLYRIVGADYAQPYALDQHITLSD